MLSAFRTSLRARALPLAVALLAVVGLTGAGFAAHLQSMAVTGRITTAFQATETAAFDLGSVSFPAALNSSYTYTSGTGNNQIQVLWSDTRTLAASATENLDLAGVLATAIGGTFTTTAVKGVVITALAANTNTVVVGGAASNTWTGLFVDATDKIAVRPGYTFVIAGGSTGYAVTAGTGDILTIANGGAGTSVTYSIAIIGI